MRSRCCRTRTMIQTADRQAEDQGHRRPTRSNCRPYLIYDWPAGCFAPAETLSTLGVDGDRMGVALLAEPPGGSRRSAARFSDGELIALALAGEGDAFGSWSGATSGRSTTWPTAPCATSRTPRTRPRRRGSKPTARWPRSGRKRSSRPGSSRSATASAATGWPSASATAATKSRTSPTRPPVPRGCTKPPRRPGAPARAIDALPEKYRVVITLFHLQGKQYEEIATVLGLPLGTVKTHLFRAKDLLRQRWATERPDGARP